MGDFVAQMVRADRFLRSVLVGRLDSGLFFTLFMNAFLWGLMIRVRRKGGREDLNN